MPIILRAALLLLCSLWLDAAAAAPLRVVAAQSTYGAIAAAVGGPYVHVVSLINNPAVDPHEFEAAPDTARDVADAALVIMNGLGYDTWMRKLLEANPVPGRRVVVAADLDPALRLPDGNPHVFFDTRVGALVAARVAADLQRLDPPHAAAFAANARALQARLHGVDARTRGLAEAYPGLRASATEPVWGYMLRRLGWQDLHSALQFQVMNGADPAPARVAALENDLRARRVRLLVYNRQVDTALSRRLRTLAVRCGVPTLGVAEFAPAGVDYADWLLGSVEDAQRALANPPMPSQACKP